MSRTIMLFPTGTDVGMTGVSMGVVHAMKLNGISSRIFKPISKIDNCNDSTISVSSSISSTGSFTQPLLMKQVKSFLSNNHHNSLMEEIIARYYKNDFHEDVVFVEGIVPTNNNQFANILNYEIAKILNAEIVFIFGSCNESVFQLQERIALVNYNFSIVKNINITGIIVNNLCTLIDTKENKYSELSETLDQSRKDISIINSFHNHILENSPLPVLGYIPQNYDLTAISVIDIAQYLDANIINKGDINTRKITSITLCTSNIYNLMQYFQPGSLLITSVKNSEALLATSLAVMNGLEIAALLLTDGYHIEPYINKLCERAFQTELPVFTVKTNTRQTSLRLHSFYLEAHNNDHERLEKLTNHISSYIDKKWIRSFNIRPRTSQYLSPHAFRYQLTEMARKAYKRIVMPEGNEPRTIKAASICSKLGIAHCVLLGTPKDIHKVAALQEIELDQDIEIIDPATRKNKYISRLVELRKSKGMTEVMASKQLEDNVMLGTLMLEQDEVDGLVSGAIHTTANTIRPSLQLIKTAYSSSLVSSIFFMLLPEHVLVYGDCAINLDPSAEQLAEIAIQSADSAAVFGIEPRVAMISYSTGNSGMGIDVEKVYKATVLVKQKRPDILIDGPLQYDAAIIPDVARAKAPKSSVAGKATVFIFPDLNTGNTTYKAVQRSAGILSIGPMLQGMRKPVNDLSRGALVDDIIYTIALTAIQSSIIKY